MGKSYSGVFVFTNGWDILGSPPLAGNQYQARTNTKIELILTMNLSIKAHTLSICFWAFFRPALFI